MNTLFGEGCSSYVSGYDGCDKHERMEFEEPNMTADFHEGDGLFELIVEKRCNEMCIECDYDEKCKKCDGNSALIN